MKPEHFIESPFGVRSPLIIYGTAWKKAQTQSLVATAIAQGFRGIDTACQPKHYNEPGVGAGVAASLNEALKRADLYLQSKFTPLSGQDPSNIPYDADQPLPFQVRESFQVSLNNLQSDYLDCLVLHSPLRSLEKTLEVWQTMEALFDAGRARQLGISNCYGVHELEALHQSARVKPAVVQNRFYAETGYDREIREFCRRHEIIYQSFWTLSANPQLLSHRTIKDLAASYARTPAQILFRFLTQSGVVPLTGTKSESHMREDLSIFEFELTQAERHSIQLLLK